jgi:hypothetical protein
MMDAPKTGWRNRRLRWALDAVEVLKLADGFLRPRPEDPINRAGIKVSIAHRLLDLADARGQSGLVRGLWTLCASIIMILTLVNNWLDIAAAVLK